MNINEACTILKKNNMKGTLDSVQKLISKGYIKAEVNSFDGSLNINENSLREYVTSFQKNMSQNDLSIFNKSSFMS